MANENPRLTALAARHKENFGEKLVERATGAAARACERLGIADSAPMDHAMRFANGAEQIEAAAVDQWLIEASNGDKAAQAAYDEWHQHRFPNSRKARWARGER
jgi:hypothetical protein